jgi:xylulokinase
MLWNDGRAGREADRLNTSRPDLPAIVGVLAMPGFTAPKIPWLAAHEPGVLERLRTVLLPKDYVRLRLTGEKLTDISDAAGTWWLDQRNRRWSEAALAATGLDVLQMPGLIEGSDAGGTIRPEWASRWGMSADVIVAGGAGDAAAGAVGIGAVHDGDAFVSLGTSGQLFVSTDSYRPSPQTMVHAFGHALPGRWFQMGAMLNGASCLAFAARLLGADIATLLAEAEAGYRGPARLLFLPYLTGERTPHNDPAARGVLFGMTPATTRAEVAQAVLEGVAFSVADAQRALAASGTIIASAGLIGGGARSLLWTRILASVLGLPLTRYRGGEKGPAYGAARLALLAVTREPAESVCTRPETLDTTLPDDAAQDAYAAQFQKFRSLYKALAPEFARF